MAIQFTCPGCKQTLAIADENRGATIRCPACGTTFTSEGDAAYPTSTAIRSQAPTMGPGYTEIAVDKAELARGPGDHADDRRRDVRWDDGDPLAIKRNDSGAVPVLFVFWLLVFGMLAVLIVTAFFWPGFLLQDNIDAEGSKDLLSLAPANSLLLAGVTEPSNLPFFDQVKKQFANMAAPGVLDLVSDTERVLVAAEFADDKPKSFLAAFLTKKPYDKDKVAKEMNLGAPQHVQGFTFFSGKVNNPDVLNMPNILDLHVAMPHPNVLVVGLAMNQAEFSKLLAQQGKPALPAAMLARARQIEGKDAWALLANEGMIKKSLKEFGPMIGLMLKRNADEALPALQRSKTLSLVYRPEDKNLRFELSLDCADEADAKTLKPSVVIAWDTIAPLLPKGVKDIPIFKDMNKSFKVEQQATTVNASVVISEQAWIDGEKRLKDANE
jgi:hypothetical protein